MKEERRCIKNLVEFKCKSCSTPIITRYCDNCGADQRADDMEIRCRNFKK